MTEGATLDQVVAESDEGEESAARTAPRRGGGIYLVSALTSQACALMRYVVMARLLGPQQLGIAATLVVTASLFDMISETGGDRFLIQDRHGGTEEVQSLVQAVHLGRGVLVALGLLAFAIPISYFYNTPQLAKGMAILALGPLINGFNHLDNRRVQREQDFRAEAVSTISAEIVGFAATLITAWLFRDFTAILYGIIVRALVSMVTSHLQATRRYRLAWSKLHAPRLGRFSAPLMLNGLMVFVASQGDRVIVGRQLGVTALGYYSAVMLLIYYPAGMLFRYMFTINIPLIAARRDQPVERGRVIAAMGGQTLLLTIGMAAGFAVVAPTMVPLLFGRRFGQAALIVGLIGSLQATRFMLNWPTTVALATGRTLTVMFSNLAHGFAFAGAFIGLAVLGGLAGLVGGFIVGELIAVGVAMVLVNRNLDNPPFHQFDRLVACTLTIALITGSNLVLDARLWWATPILIAVWACLAVWLFRREAVVIRDAMTFAESAIVRLRVKLRLRITSR